MPAVETVAAALGSLTPQDEHTFLSTDEGIRAACVAAAELGAGQVRHLRTSEYVVAAAVHGGERVLLRAGSHRNRIWHEEELEMARAWASTGVPVLAPLLPTLTAAADGVVSVWPLVEHDPQRAPLRGLQAGQVLRAMHETGRTLREGHDGEVFVRRGWRAPGKIARRLLVIADRHPALQPLLARAARHLADLVGRVDLNDMTAIHGDFQPGNWLSGPEGEWVVDLATSGWGPAPWDLTLLWDFSQPGRTFPPSTWTDFCAGYGVPADVLDGTAEQDLRRLSHAVARLAHPRTAEAARSSVSALTRLLDEQARRGIG